MAYKKPFKLHVIPHKPINKTSPLSHDYQHSSIKLCSSPMTTFALTILFSFLFIALSTSASAPRLNAEVMGIYQNWLAQHGKVQNALPDPKRFEIFKDNLRFIDEHNSVNRPYKVGLNKFADMTNEEYREKFLGTQPSPYTNLLNKKINKRYLPLPGDRLPKAVDWRKVGAVNHVKDQGQCGMDFF